jgi:hypothetical protein
LDAKAGQSGKAQVSKMNTKIEHHIKAVLWETIYNLLPETADPDALIAQHIWRDSNYVGTHHGKVVVWRGWRANLAAADERYRTLYIDVVDNVLPVVERQQLFGETFSRAVAGLPQFVVLFALNFPLQAEADIQAQGFVPRRLTRVLHACLVADADEFLARPVAQWAEEAARLLQLQSRWEQR